MDDYYNVSSIIVSSIKQIFDGKINLISGLDKLDLDLRKELNTVMNKTGKITVGDSITNNAKFAQFKHIEIQLLILIVFITVVVSLILLHRKVF